MIAEHFQSPTLNSNPSLYIDCKYCSIVCNTMEADHGGSASMTETCAAGETLTYRRHRQSHRHGDADKEGRQEDLWEEALCVSLGAVEPLDDETVELTELQPPALQLEATLAFQHLWFWGWGVVCKRDQEVRRRQQKTKSMLVTQ